VKRPGLLRFSGNVVSVDEGVVDLYVAKVQAVTSFAPLLDECMDFLSPLVAAEGPGAASALSDAMRNIRVSLSNTCISALYDRDAAKSITRRIMHALSGRVYRLKRRRLGLKGACPRSQARCACYSVLQQAVHALRFGADALTKLDGVATSSDGFVPVGGCARGVDG
jgi:hypothetical protein